jgi:DNA-binding transcriptional regulator YiaG
MPNISTVFRQEISRVARKELRGETQALRKAVTQYRTQLAGLKRRLQALETQVARLGKSTTRPGAAEASEDESSPIRYSAKGLAAHRRRLGLSAADMAKLLGVSALSVYKWESGKTRPRARQIEAIAALRGIGKREALERLNVAS